MDNDISIMDNLTIDSKKEFIIEQYNLLEGGTHTQNSQILYNLIIVKVKFELNNFIRPLYIDVKEFVNNYISSAEQQDYGYDEIKLSKIQDVVYLLEPRQQISLMCLVRRIFYTKGYDIDEISKCINKLERILAWKNKQFLRSIRLRMASDIYAVLLTITLYVVIISLIMLPAPFECFEIIEVELKDYNASNLLNHIINTLAVITGNDNISPVITPIGLKGVILYFLGKLLFYLLIANYAFKKIEDYLTIK